jgi:hypothetical protein
MKLKVIIAGSRDFDSYELVKDKFLEFSEYIDSEFEIISGGARGADRLGEKLAKELGMSVQQFIPDWNGPKGKSAGHIRNAEMANVGDILLAFWDGESRGTEGMIDLANKKGLAVSVYTYVWIKTSETTGDGFQTNFTNFYKQLHVNGEPYGRKIAIKYDEYLGGD